MHAGHASVEAGDDHLAHLADALRNSPLWPNMLVVMTVDENVGWWDHVAPPKVDRWGPGTRVPAQVLSPFARQGFIDHTTYDTGFIRRFITRRFGLKKLPVPVLREQSMIAAGGPRRATPSPRCSLARTDPQTTESLRCAACIPRSNHTPASLWPSTRCIRCMSRSAATPTACR